jgi:hypothetical protein
MARHQSHRARPPWPGPRACGASCHVGPVACGDRYAGCRRSARGRTRRRAQPISFVSFRPTCTLEGSSTKASPGRTINRRRTSLRQVGRRTSGSRSGGRLDRWHRPLRAGCPHAVRTQIEQVVASAAPVGHPEILPRPAPEPHRLRADRVAPCAQHRYSFGGPDC